MLQLTTSSLQNECDAAPPSRNPLGLVPATAPMKLFNSLGLSWASCHLLKTMIQGKPCGCPVTQGLTL